MKSERDTFRERQDTLLDELAKVTSERDTALVELGVARNVLDIQAARMLRILTWCDNKDFVRVPDLKEELLK